MFAQAKRQLGLCRKVCAALAAALQCCVFRELDSRRADGASDMNKYWHAPGTQQTLPGHFCSVLQGQLLDQLIQPFGALFWSLQQLEGERQAHPSQ